MAAQPRGTLNPTRGILQTITLTIKHFSTFNVIADEDINGHMYSVVVTKYVCYQVCYTFWSYKQHKSPYICG